MFKELLYKQGDEYISLGEKHQLERNEIFNVIFNNYFACDIKEINYYDHLVEANNDSDEIKILTEIKIGDTRNNKLLKINKIPVLLEFCYISNIDGDKYYNYEGVYKIDNFPKIIENNNSIILKTEYNRELHIANKIIENKFIILSIDREKFYTTFETFDKFKKDWRKNIENANK